MWECQQCGEKIEDIFDVCWNCGTGKDGSSPDDSFLLERKTGESVTALESSQKTPAESVASVKLKKLKALNDHMIRFGLVGFVVGWFIGFLNRRSSLLSFDDVITRGAYTNRLLAPAAEKAFDLALSIAIIGAIIGAVISYFVKQKEHEKLKEQHSIASDEKESAEERLKALKKLHDKDVITEQEYQQKRREILKEL